MTEKLSQAALDALAKRDRQYRSYAKKKKLDFERLCAADQHGRLLSQFAEHLAKYRRLDDAEPCLSFVRAATWLNRASAECRYAALGLAADRIAAIRVAHRLAPFDDPLPGEDDDVFQIIKRVLA